MKATPRLHGGPDASGTVPFDFSTNGNACGPNPQALSAVRSADARFYPDPHYQALREALAERHGVAASRIVPCASGSEAIQRLTARAVQRGVRQVLVPRHAYGDYRHAAAAWGLDVSTEPAGEGANRAPGLTWLCDPSSPLGQPAEPPARNTAATLVLDRAYAPLRLSGIDPWTTEALALRRAWQLFTPNKALGLTGVRAAYLVAPAGAEDEAAALDRLAASWCIGCHGLAMLQAWCRPEVESWLADCRETLRGWKAAQQAVCESVGWRCEPSDANFFVAGLPVDSPADLLPTLLTKGIRLRDCASFGLPGHVRLGVLPPAAQQALFQALQKAPGAPTTIGRPKT